MAIERLDAATAAARLPEVRERVGTLLGRIGGFIDLAAGARILDVGAAQGVYVAELRRRGYDATGVDPSPEAVGAAREIASTTEHQTHVVLGSAESLPFEAGAFDLVTAFSVLEHVGELDAAFAEAARVLRPGGAFYFYTTSAICPRQAEIRHFPLFPWYPAGVKRRIMDWAVRERPALVNYTSAPAYHWFTPRRTALLATRFGFTELHDRWDLRAASTTTPPGRAIGVVRRNRLTRFAANLVVQDCSYLAVKDGR